MLTMCMHCIQSIYIYICICIYTFIYNLYASVSIHLYIHIYADSLWLSPSGFPLAATSTRLLGGCVTPPNAPRSLAAPALAAMSWWSVCGASAAGPPGRSLVQGAPSSPQSSRCAARTSTAPRCSSPLQGCGEWIWIVFFIFLYLICIKTPHPPGRRTMAHRSHGHMNRQGEGYLSLVIHIYIYIITDTIPSCLRASLRLFRLCLRHRRLVLQPVLPIEGTPPRGHRGKISKYVYIYIGHSESACICNTVQTYWYIYIYIYICKNVNNVCPYVTFACNMYGI